MNDHPKEAAGVGDSVAMDIVGHDTEAVSRDYTDIPLDVKRSAINKLPNISGNVPGGVK